MTAGLPMTIDGDQAVEAIVDLVAEAARDLRRLGEIDLEGDLHRDTPLFGKDGLLDSMALVRLVVAVEQAIDDRFDRAVSLADERAMSQTSSPYRTVGALAEYAASLLRGDG